MLGIFFCLIVSAVTYHESGFSEEMKFSKADILVGKTKLNVEIAKTETEQQRGLMFRNKLDEESGMLFVYSREQRLSFWMKNTFIPLSIGFFDKNQELVDIQDMTPVTSEMQSDVPSYRSAGSVMYALEVNRGWFTKHKIKLKTKFKFVKSSK